MIDLPDGLPREKALLALTVLSENLRNEVLGNQTIIERFDISVTRPIKLDGVTVDRRVLFAALGAAADGLPIPPLVDSSGVAVAASISMNADGAGIVEIGRKRWRFEDAVFLSGQVDVRAAALEARIATCSLAMRDRAYLRQLVRNPGFSDGEFFEMNRVLTSAPEVFVRELQEHLAREQVGRDDLLPDNLRHWDHLVPPVEHSSTLDQYLAYELNTEWNLRLAEVPSMALANIALTCAAPALIPRQLLASLSAEEAADFVGEQSRHDDPFGLICALQLCADRVATDPQFVALGEAVLDRLFGDPARLTTACQVFAAAFIIATAYLAEHQILGGRPPFWRRLAAATHASLVVRGCEISGATQEGVVRWAVHIAGNPYLLSVLSEFTELPRWRPEWIDDHYLFADIYGRALSAVRGIPAESVSASWQGRLDAIKALKDDTAMELLALYPAVLEGARPAKPNNLPETGEVADLFRRLVDDPSIDHLMRLSVVIYTYGFPDWMLGTVIGLAKSIRQGPSSLDEPRTRRVLEVISHIAVQALNAELANLVVEICIAKASVATDPQSALDAALRLVECSGALGDPSEAPAQLAQRLERLAVVLPTAEMCGVLVGVLTQLKTIQRRLEPLLGRALAWVVLGRAQRAA